MTYTDKDVPTDASVTIKATHGLDDAWERPDVLFVPGGTHATFDLLENDRVMDFLAEQSSEAGWVTSVCTGSLLLAAAGALKGYRATSHWFVRDILRAFGAEPVDERWVIDRNRISGGGVTAGIDFGLAMMAHIAGDDEQAKAAELILEYAPAPPFSCGTPELAGADLHKAVVERFASVGSEDRGRQIATALSRFQRLSST